MNSVKKFNEILTDFDLYDTWRQFNRDSKDFTWSKRTPFAARRLDYILSTSSTFDKTINCHIISVPTSDHRGCFIHFKLNEIVKGDGYWKFNNSLLGDIVFVNQMNEHIESFIKDNETDNQTLWELLKLHSKEFSILYSKQKSMERKKRYTMSSLTLTLR